MTAEEIIRQQLDQQMRTFALRKPQAVILEFDGRRRAAFATIKRAPKWGDCPVYLETVSPARLNGERVALVEWFRLQKNNTLVFVNDNIISEDEARDWIETHKKGLKEN